MQRFPAVAGQFYSGSSKQLRKDLAALIPESSIKRKVFGIIAPHAGYIYSGNIAGRVYATIEIPSTVLILGPNHHGVGAGVALYPSGNWIMPLAPVTINSRLNSLLLQNVPYIRLDSVAHEIEHSLEVQVPFIHFLRPDVTISAICLGHENDRNIVQLGEGIAKSILAYGESVLIIASSDMTHYENAESALCKDKLALEKVLNFDPEGLLRVCRNERITMCGVVPAAVMLVAAGKMGAEQAELVAYGTSGDVTGDMQQVVGYAAVTVR